MTDEMNRLSASEGDADLESQRANLERRREHAARQAESAKVVRESEAKTINKRLGELRGFIAGFLNKYTDGIVKVDDLDLNDKLQDWNDAFARGEVPKPFQKRRLEKDPGKAGDLIYYAAIVNLIRSRIDAGLAWAVPAANMLADTRDSEYLTAALELDGKLAKAKDHQQQVDLRKFEATKFYDRSLPEFMEGLRITLGLLCAMDPEHLLLGVKRMRHQREAATNAHTQAAIKYFSLIIQKREVRTLEEILHWAGTSYIPKVDLDGNTYSFKKEDGFLVISVRAEDGTSEEVYRQNLSKKSNLYKWRRAALDRLAKPS